MSDVGGFRLRLEIDSRRQGTRLHFRRRPAGTTTNATAALTARTPDDRTAARGDAYTTAMQAQCPMCDAGARPRRPRRARLGRCPRIPPRVDALSPATRPSRTQSPDQAHVRRVRAALAAERRRACRIRWAPRRTGQRLPDASAEERADSSGAACAARESTLTTTPHPASCAPGAHGGIPELSPGRDPKGPLT